VEEEFTQSEDAPEQPREADEIAVSEPASDELPQVDAKPESAVNRKQDPWKTAFIVLVGVVLLSAVLIYSTSTKRTEPTTVLQTDANGQPVQPLNPASGVEEERLAAMSVDAANANANLSTLPGQLPGGDGYDPWANGGKPPPGSPVVPGGGYVTIPNGGSQFMPPECIMQPSGIYLCPVPTNANTAKPTPTPRKNVANANVQASPTPAEQRATPTPVTPRATPTPRTRAVPVPTRSPEIQ
jgi:hypothetical protein